MDITTITPDVASIASDAGYRFVPAPKTGSTFDGILNIIGGVANAMVQNAGIGGDYQGLIAMQLEAQRQMMLVSMVSNVEKSKHETQMAPVRNIRVG